MIFVKINETLYPVTMSEYGITTEKVEQMFLDFCKQDNK